jgi:hypothetical protein
MVGRDAMDTPNSGPFELVGQRLGALPVINHFLDRIRLEEVLTRWLPEPDRRFKLTPAAAIRLLVVNLLVGRAPLYGLGEWAAGYAPELLGLPGPDTAWLNDDRMGRALLALFDADRASLLTELIVGVVAEFGVDTAEMHNDSTSVSVHGQYRDADGAPRRGKPTPAVTFGHSKDHRPDLKQLVWILTVSADGSVPMAYRLADGNTSDDPTHIPTWDALVKVLGRRDFLYVADSKLCSGQAMRHIDGQGGRFVTVLTQPRRGQMVPRLDPDQQAGLDRSDPAARQTDRRPGPSLVHLPRTAALGRGVPHHLGPLHRQGRPRRARPPRPHRGRRRRHRRISQQARRAQDPAGDPRRRRAGHRQRLGRHRFGPLAAGHRQREHRRGLPPGAAWPARRRHPLPAHHPHPLHRQLAIPR